MQQRLELNPDILIYNCILLLSAILTRTHIHVFDMKLDIGIVTMGLALIVIYSPPSCYSRLLWLFSCSIAIVFFAAASIRNYPGGISIVSLHALHAMTEHNSSQPILTREKVSVHIDVLPAMTGVTQFLQRPDWSYSKMEGLGVDDFQYTRFNYLLNERQNIPGYVCAGVVKGFSGLQFEPSAGNLAAVFFRMKPFLYIHERARADNSDGDDLKHPRQSRLKDVIVEHTQELTFNEDYIEVCEK